MTIEVVKPGLLTTVQDLGRYGHQHFGVVVGGAMDEWAHRVANVMVGNDENEATLEITMQGPSLRFRERALVALCGGDLGPQMAGRPFPQGRPVLVREGAVLEFGRPHAGCRAYLAVRGGLPVPPVLGSRSTFVRAKLGGIEGRALRKGDEVPVTGWTPGWYPRLEQALAGSDAPFETVPWSGGYMASGAGEAPIRVIPGPQWALFSRESQEAFVGTRFRVAMSSDRMGYRLEGATITPKRKVEMISEAVTFGTVQVPPDGNPIILMADRQTTGGYPKIAQVASVDLPRLAQTRPREALAFERVTLETAEQAYLERERTLRLIRQSIEFKRGH